MIRPILFRGGMFGDLLLAMSDKSCLLEKTVYSKEYKKNSVAGYYIKYTRTQQKKFFNYPQIKKEIYYSRFMKLKRVVYVVTHDTDFSKNYQDQTIQVICSDRLLTRNFAERFYRLHSNKVKEEAKAHMGQHTGDFVEDYAKDIERWQDYHQFKNRFDIRNIYNKEAFLADYNHFFKPSDPEWSRLIYTDHFKQKEIW
jgi:hypothetical protein